MSPTASRTSDDPVVAAITKDTKVTVWAAVVCAMALFTAYVKADSRLRVMESHIQALQYEVSNLSHLFEVAAGDRWTQTEMYYWYLLFKEKNPEIEVPAVPKPTRAE